ncbi:ectoine utilization protein EutC [Gluconacetobacter azotocaptans]|uniref:Ectoine utilization protein EutC n=1 Tax=Gluconacetobacter azotocaptans TaxID=142834 RepID=A0A7W4PFI1_9PROT|nr:ectoine utilization protein EutC [Gluconacetobacter azotocaptans]MBB2188926.1 ectoine utilization protein EutC [Gluconacetobacter azotocaptans]MBM9401502.1 ectoine utilization protein EutC [Gluconacetobacter azotocaptans]GBQ25993.1 putative ornithine cyclodeaminase [Gluconacetobacter azotocaptans DSM 13594]
MKILKEADLRHLMALDLDVVNTIEGAFLALATLPVAMPDILRLDIADRGEVDVKTAYVPGIESFAIKISPGFFGNPALGLPSLNGLMVLLSARTGLTEALLLDNGYLTDLRTAAAGGVAARWLSRPDSRIAAIYGAGVQARLQLQALTLVRPIECARIWARRPEQAQETAAWCATRFGIPVVAVDDPAVAAEGADILVTTTPATQPVLRRDWLQPGQHVTAMGSDAEHKNELDPRIVADAAPYVADTLAQTRRLGELRRALADGLVPADRPLHELGAIIAGHQPGRVEAGAITVADLTGTGIQDTAIATLAYRRAVTAGP